MALLSRFVLPTAVGYFLLAASFHVARDMFTKDYDADLDHHMYFGQRLLFGELIWTREIYDKFPIIQYFFAIPAYFGSIRVWVVMSALMLIASAVAVYVSVPTLLPIATTTGLIKRDHLFSLLCAAFYVYLSTTTPPSLAHINSFTTSCLVVALCMAVLSHHASMRTSRTRRLALQLGSATFASFAMAIRPFLGAPSLLLVGWIEVRHVLGDVETMRRRENSYSPQGFAVACWDALPAILRWATFAGIALFITNFAPYVASGAIDAMTNGIMHNSQKLNPQSPLSILIEQFHTIINSSNWYYIAFWISMIVIPIRFVWEKRRRVDRATPQDHDGHREPFVPDQAMLDLLLGVIAPVAALEAMVLARHWWDHYWQMFVAIGVVNFVIMAGLLARRWPSLSECAPQAVGLVGVCAVALGTLVGASANQEAHHPQQAKFEEIVEFLGQRQSIGLPTDFLDGGDMYPHWQLRESRHGFPHAQNMQHIILGWYQYLPRMTHLEFPYTRDELCRQINKRGPSVVFMQFSYMFGCLLSRESNYILERNSPELIIFVRSSS
jgi:hypothetical protein